MTAMLQRGWEEPKSVPPAPFLGSEPCIIVCLKAAAPTWHGSESGMEKVDTGFFTGSWFAGWASLIALAARQQEKNCAPEVWGMALSSCGRKSSVVGYKKRGPAAVASPAACHSRRVALAPYYTQYTQPEHFVTAV